jgi:hypothetical protein
MSHLVGPDVSAPARCRRDVGRNILSAPERAGRQGDLIVWNADFGQVALDYRVAPALCWPRAAQQKGAVEQLVGRGKRSFFTCRRFHDRADLERQLAAWLVDVKTMRPSRATGVIPAVRLADGRGRHIELRGRSYRTRHAPLDLNPGPESRDENGRASRP